ncbi:hypothetical protein [Pararhodospirillum photometricum]|uniref:Uncharacterized protein n=1 Tax=Pararhodospirillum photometricum DSM 122 TaxID=1150469 RepID=H6SL65_PARPM|nr:hypothetical protein [Pararhodospirillum photometricum]CCG08730.1 unnamed protein product [Pararhodospirillum photometricum DSM 122]
MAYKDEKVVGIIMENVRHLEERCPGYREEIGNVVAEIIQAERQHQFARTNISQKFSDLIGRVGTLLQLAEQSGDA